jgi:hypothetical protein
MRRALPVLTLVTLGVVLGLAYGWAVDPVTFRETTASALRADYRADYVLMVAETYHGQQNLELARRQLGIFGGDTPSQVCAQALVDARAAGFSAGDLTLLEVLCRQLNASKPTPSAEAIQP